MPGHSHCSFGQSTMIRLWGGVARRSARYVQAAPCLGPCKQSQARAVVVASQTPSSNSGSTPRFSEPWRRFTSTAIISKSTLNRLKVGELRDVLQERGLSTEGLKADLVERMHAALHDQGNGVSSSAAGEAGSTAAPSAELASGERAAAGQHELHDSTVAPQPPAVSKSRAADEDMPVPASVASEQPLFSASRAEISGRKSLNINQQPADRALSEAEASMRQDADPPASARSSAVAGSAAGDPPGAARSGAGDPRGAARLGVPDPAAAKTGMAVTWLGTSSGAPTLKRNVSCISLRLPHATFLVDAGEGSCKQLEAAGMDAARVRTLFITHMHGDHCFGIGGMLRTVSTAREGTPLADMPFHVYGPPGLHRLVTAALGFDGRPLSMPLMAVELTVDPAKGRPPAPAAEATRATGAAEGRVMFATLAPDRTPDAEAALQRAPERWRRRSGRHMSAEHEVEVIEGLTWTIPCGGGFTATAAQLQHRVPCWGYVFQEPGTPPTPDQALMASAGVTEDAVRSAMQRGPSAPVALPDGSSVPVRELVRPPRRGRKVVLLGDTCNSRAILRVGEGADLLSHEATFTADMREKAHIAQHSTAPMAGAFARALGAQTLVLTHFSGRFLDWKGGAEEDALPSDIQMLKRQAKAAYGSNNILAAYDFYTHHVPVPGFGGAAGHPKGQSSAARKPQRQQQVAA
ncbi:Zinc phosphodiesterase ELAC protein 1 [Coccomyxa sp. Obi]|nr:Zinc phosphodiesterase ELAC protein 1 [Coccomyxa sp. Obi]